MKNDHPEIKFGKTGVLLINLGTPESTSWWDIRKYLKEFLSDRRGIEVNPILWKVILNLFILTFRPSKTAKAYKEIWMNDKNMSPLLYYTQKQAEKISSSFSKENNIIKKIFLIIISIIAFILLIDTFKNQISVIFPGILQMSDSLYLVINDLKLFIKDLVR